MPARFRWATPPRCLFWKLISLATREMNRTPSCCKSMAGRGERRDRAQRPRHSQGTLFDERAFHAQAFLPASAAA